MRGRVVGLAFLLGIGGSGEAKTFGVHAAAACPSAGPAGTTGPCEATYNAMLKSTEGRGQP